MDRKRVPGLGRGIRERFRGHGRALRSRPGRLGSALHSLARFPPIPAYGAVDRRRVHRFWRNRRRRPWRRSALRPSAGHMDGASCRSRTFESARSHGSLDRLPDAGLGRSLGHDTPRGRGCLRPRNGLVVRDLQCWLSWSPIRPYGRMDRIGDDRLRRRGEFDSGQHGRPLQPSYRHVDSDDDNGRAFDSHVPHRGLDGHRDDRVGRRRRELLLHEHRKTLLPALGFMDCNADDRRASAAIASHRDLVRDGDDRLGRFRSGPVRGRSALRSGRRGLVDRVDLECPKPALLPSGGVDRDRDDRVGRTRERKPRHGFSLFPLHRRLVADDSRGCPRCSPSSRSRLGRRPPDRLGRTRVEHASLGQPIQPWRFTGRRWRWNPRMRRLRRSGRFGLPRRRADVRRCQQRLR